MPEIVYAKSQEEYAIAATLFREYASWLNIDLCFQHFDKELQQLPAMYALPSGGIILARENDVFIGCVGVRKIDRETAELKRMWVKPGQQAKGVGSALLQEAIQLATGCGYKKNTVRYLEYNDASY